MSGKKIRVGQLGVGYWGPNLLRDLSANSEFTVSRVVDLSDKRLAFVREKFPEIQTGSDPALVLENPDIDAVVIATPVSTHFELVKQALQNGKHVLVEKPLVTKVSEAEILIALARQQGKVLMSGHTYVYNPAVHVLKNLVSSGELGQIRYIYSQRLNLGRVRSDVDALWNLAPHDVSMIQFLLGNQSPENITRVGGSYVQRGIDDVVFLTMAYPNRVIANIHVSWLDPQRVRRFVVVGSEKMAVFDDAAKDKVVVHNKGIDRLAVVGEHMDYDSSERTILDHRDGQSKVLPVNPTSPLQIELQHYADCINGKTECLTGAEHSLSVIRILEHATKPLTDLVIAPELELPSSWVSYSSPTSLPLVMKEKSEERGPSAESSKEAVK